MHYYQPDLALIHDRGYGRYADHCAPGILDLLAPVRDGLVLELGCGSGALTRHLLAAGLRVIATDASPDMLAWPGRPGRGDLRQLTLPGDPLPPADAVVSVGHVLSYCPTRRPSRRRWPPRPARCGRAGCWRSTSWTWTTGSIRRKPRSRTEPWDQLALVPASARTARHSDHTSIRLCGDRAVRPQSTA